MRSVLDIRVQKLFLVALILKVGSSFTGWLIRDPWILGFMVPLLIMSAYIVLGYFRRDNDVTDEKFADTCYYLGFIFTITSIIFSLFDLPYIGTRIQDIAVRFGAAMVSTVLGLGVRVYLVSFRKDVADAIKDAEDAVLDATRKFTEQLTVVLERLRDFESQVDTAAKTSVERVNLQVESLSRDHSARLAEFFSELTQRNQDAFTAALSEVRTASQRLADSVDGYSLGMRTNLASIEAKVSAFTDAVADRLKTTTFPDDYFSEHLRKPLARLEESSYELAAGIKGALQDVTESTLALAAALKKFKDKAGATEGSLETVLRLTLQQQVVLDSARGQLTALEHLGDTLSKVDGALASHLASTTESNKLTASLTDRVGGVVADGAETRKAVQSALKSVAEALEAQVKETQSVVRSLQTGAMQSMESSRVLADKLDVSTATAQSVSVALAAASKNTGTMIAKLELVAGSEERAVGALEALGRQGNLALEKVDGAVRQLQSLVGQLTAMGVTLQAQGNELRNVATQIHDTRASISSSGSTLAPSHATPPHSVEAAGSTQEPRLLSGALAGDSGLVQDRNLQAAQSPPAV